MKGKNMVGKAAWTPMPASGGAASKLAGLRELPLSDPPIHLTDNADTWVGFSPRGVNKEERICKLHKSKTILFCSPLYP